VILDGALHRHYRRSWPTPSSYGLELSEQSSLPGASYVKDLLARVVRAEGLELSMGPWRFDSLGSVVWLPANVAAHLYGTMRRFVGGILSSSSLAPRSGPAPAKTIAPSDFLYSQIAALSAQDIGVAKIIVFVA
jgi:hypothetical protein